MTSVEFVSEFDEFIQHDEELLHAVHFARGLTRHELIAERAEKLYRERDETRYTSLDNWLDAEREIFSPESPSDDAETPTYKYSSEKLEKLINDARDDVHAMSAIALKLRDGRDKFPKDVDKAYALLRQLCQQSPLAAADDDKNVLEVAAATNSESLDRIARRLRARGRQPAVAAWARAHDHFGFLCWQRGELPAAVEQLALAAGAGHAQALFNLGVMAGDGLLEKAGAVSGDDDGGGGGATTYGGMMRMRLHMLAARIGSLNAHHALAEAFAGGVFGVRRDLERAVRFAEQACAGGDVRDDSLQLYCWLVCEAAAFERGAVLRALQWLGERRRRLRSARTRHGFVFAWCLCDGSWLDVTESVLLRIRRCERVVLCDVRRLRQVRNNCGATSVALAMGGDIDPLALKRTACPDVPASELLDEGTGWTALAAAAGNGCRVVTYACDESGLEEALADMKRSLLRGAPVVIDVREGVDVSDERAGAHTVVVCGWIGGDELETLIVYDPWGAERVLGRAVARGDATRDDPSHMLRTYLRTSFHSRWWTPEADAVRRAVILLDQNPLDK